MNGYEFWASVINSVAWPVVILLVLIFGRKKVGNAVNALIEKIPFLQELNTSWFQAQFGDAAKGARDQAEATAAATGGSPSVEGDGGEAPDSGGPERSTESTQPPWSGRHTTTHRFVSADRLISVDPRAAVLTAWIELEAVLQQRYAEVVSTEIVTPPSRMIKTVFDRSLAGRSMQEITLNLLRLRNELMHRAGTEVSIDAATDYIDAAQTVADFLVRDSAQ